MLRFHNGRAVSYEQGVMSRKLLKKISKLTTHGSKQNKKNRIFVAENYLPIKRK